MINKFYKKRGGNQGSGKLGNVPHTASQFSWTPGKRWYISHSRFSITKSETPSFLKSCSDSLSILGFQDNIKISEGRNKRSKNFVKLEFNTNHSNNQTLFPISSRVSSYTALSQTARVVNDTEDRIQELQKKIKKAKFSMMHHSVLSQPHHNVLRQGELFLSVVKVVLQRVRLGGGHS